MAEEEKSFGVLGVIVIFSFVSMIFLFMSLLLIGSFNNMALYKLYNVSNDFVSSGLIPSSFTTTISETASGMLNIVQYIDIIWFISFISLVISGLVFSYLRRKENYFSTLSMSVLGIIIITYVGGIFIDLTNWFNINILLKVFPTFNDLAPIFSWYISNIGIINLILITLNIIANFIDLDFFSFNKRKDGESLEEI